MKSVRNAAVLLIAMGVLTACGGGGGGTSPTPTASANDFTSFVTGLLADTSDTASPVSVNNRQFTFSDEDNPGAYKGVVSAP